MHNLTKTAKIFLFIIFVSFSLWFGGYVLRQMVIYQFFEAEGLILKTNYSANILHETLYVILPIFIFNIATYIVFILSFFVFIFISKLSLKKEGWLLITCLIICICAPFEIYLLLKDYEISKTIYSQSFDPIKVINMIKERLILLSSFSLIEIISFAVIIFLYIFKPLKKS